ncbi:glycerate kinase [Psychromonas sp. RZ22]|uniref:glycerate kinase n=1 Tax=Psychromonas algarum TaxID=2555643 RepID=UPI00106866ED|nr:glycerate kinase [Psychromonas sp. RZ22]TEW53781.1 glycerate kinase [Psychromonas sp. RZ22]
MKIIIAPDSFKESLTAKQVCVAIETGMKRVIKHAEYHLIPVADGGEGTVQSLVDATDGKIVNLTVTGPLSAPVQAFYGLLGNNSDTAVIEMAAASGLHHVAEHLRDPKQTSSYGTGELIKAALDNGVSKIIIGLGGSATNDGGIGMLSALGVTFIDKDGNEIEANGDGLQKIHQINIDALDKRLASCEILVACDVDNPLCGERGASHVFGPQKGATKEDIQLLDKALKHYGECIQQQFNIDVLNQAGTGAAGGIGAALIAFTNATLKPGIELVLEAVQLKQCIHDADLVITGEGRIDGQTIYGKTPMGVAKIAKQFDIPVIAVAGCLGDKHQAVYGCGIDAVFAATPGAMTLQQAFANASVNLENVSENIAKLWSIKIN